LPAILLNTSITCSASGCSIDGGTRSGFPSLEAWGYKPGFAPRMIFNVPETNPGDLGTVNAKVPRGWFGPSEFGSGSDYGDPFWFLNALGAGLFGACPGDDCGPGSGWDPGAPPPVLKPRY
jgi:hypothetical protein